MMLKPLLIARFPQTRARRAILGLILATLALSGCHSNSSDEQASSGGSTSGGTTTGGSTTGGTTGGASSSLSAVYVSIDNGGSGTVIGTDNALKSVQQRITTGLDGEIVLNNGLLYQTGLLNGAGKILAITDVANRGTVVTFDSSQDVIVDVPSLVQPQGISVGPFGYEPVIADAESTNTAGPAAHLLTRFQAPAINKQPPQEYAVISQSLTGSPAWSAYYDVPGDRLFLALTSGSVAVFDNLYPRSQNGTLSVSRTLTPGATDANGLTTKISKSLHGISYNALTDILFVSDIGDSANNSDGAIYMFRNASLASDTAGSAAGSVPIVVPDRIITGSATQLGNPVSVSYSNNLLAVAEQGNGLILLFKNPGLGSKSNIAPDYSVTPQQLGVSGTPISVAVP